MIWITLACLGVPIWMVIGALAIVFWNRHTVKKQSGIFAAKLRLESGSFAGFGEKPASCYCEWVHDVLFAHKGLIMRTVTIPVAAAEEPQQADDDLMILRFRLDDGSVLQMSDFAETGELAQGPFLLAEAPDSEEE